MKLSTLAAAMPFAHYLGLAPAHVSTEVPETALVAAPQDDDKQREGESDDDYAKRMDDRAKAAEAKGGKAASPQVDDDGDSEDDADDGEDVKRAGRAKAARARERMRCASIVAAGLKAGQLHQACALAFDSQMSSAQALSVLRTSAMDAAAAKVDTPTLEGVPRPKGPTLDERMSHVVTGNPGNAGEVSAPDLVSQIIAAGKIARGEKI